MSDTSSSHLLQRIILNLKLKVTAESQDNHIMSILLNICDAVSLSFPPLGRHGLPERPHLHQDQDAATSHETVSQPDAQDELTQSEAARQDAGQDQVAATSQETVSQPEAGDQAGSQPPHHHHSPPGQSQAGPQPPEAVEEEETEPHYQGRDRIFWIKVDNEEFNSLSVARKQHNLKRRLDIMGRVRHLEYQSHNNYRAVFCGKEKVSIEAAGSDLSMMELSDSIPATYIPNYEVDRNGFYTVSGRFPEDVSNEERAKFASDMKNIGAFGFTSNESVFTLHYVTSRSAEEAVSLSLTQYSNFNLKLEKEEREE